jgi:hypothetical protein
VKNNMDDPHNPRRLHGQEVMEVCLPLITIFVRANMTFPPSMEARRIPAVPADNLTLAMDSYPEYPKIKRTGTRGLLRSTST